MSKTSSYLFCFFVVSIGSFRLSVVEIEEVVIVEVTFDGIEIYQHIFELF